MLESRPCGLGDRDLERDRRGRGGACSRASLRLPWLDLLAWLSTELLRLRLRLLRCGEEEALEVTEERDMVVRISVLPAVVMSGTWGEDEVGGAVLVLFWLPPSRSKWARIS